MHRGVAACALLALLATAPSCSRSTGKLSPERLQELQGEGIVRRQDDLWFRYSHGMGTRRGGWEEHRASIVVTGARILIHQNDRVILEITERSTGRYALRREGDRLSLRSGVGRSARSWAFHPMDDPEGWAKDMRAVLKKTAGGSRDT
jgi:hypothetical protein